VAAAEQRQPSRAQAAATEPRFEPEGGAVRSFDIAARDRGRRAGCDLTADAPVLPVAAPTAEGMAVLKSLLWGPPAKRRAGAISTKGSLWPSTVPAASNPAGSNPRGPRRRGR
jgi:hypothetical protein